MYKLPKVSGNAMIKYLTRKGFRVIRRRGSHTRMCSDDSVTTIPSGTGIIKTGTLLKILSDVNISRGDFISDHNKNLVK